MMASSYYQNLIKRVLEASTTDAFNFLYQEIEWILLYKKTNGFVYNFHAAIWVKNSVEISRLS